MTSKISWIKLIQEDLKRRSAVLALVAVTYFLGLPVFLLMNLDRVENYVRQGYETEAYLIKYYESYVANSSVAVLVIFTGLVIGVTGYCYLHSRVKLDLYHSLPVKRGKLFWTQYVSGLFIFLVPYTVCLCLCGGIGAANGLMTETAVHTFLRLYLFRILEFLAAYGLAILACELTGKTLVAILGGTAIATYLPMLLFVDQSLRALFYDTYAETSASDKWYAILSPLGVGIYAEGMKCYQNGKWLFIGTAVLLLWAVVMTVLACGLSRIRPTEGAECSMAFPKTEGIIKILLVVPVSLLVGAFLKDISSRWFFIGIVVTVILLSAVIEFVYHYNMKEVFRGKWQILAAGVLALAISIFFSMDLGGYDTRLPAKEDVAQMGLYDSQISGSFCYTFSSDGAITYSDELALEQLMTGYVDELYALAKDGTDREKSGDTSENTQSVTIAFRTASGKTILRRYHVGKEALKTAETALFTDSEYVQKVYPIFYHDQELTAGVYISGTSGIYGISGDVTKEKEFLDLYKEELSKVDYDTLKDHTIAEVMVNTLIKGEDSEDGSYTTSFSEDGYPICDTFTETIAFLKKEGIDLDKQLAPEDIEEITVTDWRENESNGVTTTVTDQEEIEELLATLQFVTLDLAQDVGLENNISVSILLKDGEYVSNYYFPAGEVPDFLNQNE